MSGERVSAGRVSVRGETDHCVLCRERGMLATGMGCGLVHERRLHNNLHPSRTVRDVGIDLVRPQEGEEAHCRQDWLADKLNRARPLDNVGEDGGRTDDMRCEERHKEQRTRTRLSHPSAL